MNTQQKPDFSSARSHEIPIKPGTGAALLLHRITMLMFVCVCAGLGVLLIMLPWTPNWTDNHFLLAYPALRQFVTSGFVRGMCSGLGILDIWIGFWEALHYHETQRI